MTHSGRPPEMERGTTEPAADVVVLRDVAEGDLCSLFDHQRDPVANRMAAFAARDREAFMAHWRTKILSDDTVIKKTVLFRDRVAGYIVCYRQSDKWLVGYWLGKRFWGQGIATRALASFLTDVTTRPLHAYVAKHNVASVRVLEKCGFTLSAELDALARAGSDAVEELVFTLTK